MLNAVVRGLLRGGEMSRAAAYLSQIDEKNFTLEASTTSLLISVISKGHYQEHMESLPEKYHFLFKASNR
jgi:hypothetical protein